MDQLVINVEDATAEKEVLPVNRLINAFDELTKRPPASEPLAPVYVIDSESIVFGAGGTDADITEHELPTFLDVTPEEVETSVTEMVDGGEWDIYVEQFSEEDRSEITPDMIREIMLSYVDRSSPLIQAANILCREKRVHMLSVKSDKAGWPRRRFLPLTLASVECSCGTDGAPNFALSYLCTYLSPSVAIALLKSDARPPQQLLPLSCEGRANGIKTVFYGWVPAQKTAGGHWLFLSLSRLVVGGELYYDTNVELVSTLRVLPEVSDRRAMSVSYRATLCSVSGDADVNTVDLGAAQQFLQRYYQGRSDTAVIVSVENDVTQFDVPRPRNNDSGGDDDDNAPIDSSARAPILSGKFYTAEQVKAIAGKKPADVTLDDLFPQLAKSASKRNGLEHEYETLVTMILFKSRRDIRPKKVPSKELEKRLRELGLEEWAEYYSDEIFSRLIHIETELCDARMEKLIDVDGQFKTVKQAMDKLPRRKRELTKLSESIRTYKQFAVTRKQRDKLYSWQTWFAASFLKPVPPFLPGTASDEDRIYAILSWIIHHEEKWKTLSSSLDFFAKAVEETASPDEAKTTTTTPPLPPSEDDQALLNNAYKDAEARDAKNYLQRAHEGPAVEEETVLEPEDEDEEEEKMAEKTRHQPARRAKKEAEKRDDMMVDYETWISRVDIRFFDAGAFFFNWLLTLPVSFFNMLRNKTLQEEMESREIDVVYARFQQTLVTMRTRFDGAGFARRPYFATSRPSLPLEDTSGRTDYYGPSCPLRRLLARWTAGEWELMMRDDLGHFLLQAPSAESEETGYSKDTLLAAALAKLAFRYEIQSTVARRRLGIIREPPNEEEVNSLTLGEKIYLQRASDNIDPLTSRPRRALAGMRPLGNIILGRAILRLRPPEARRAVRDLVLAYPPGRLFLEAESRTLTFKNRQPYDFDMFVRPKEEGAAAAAAEKEEGRVIETQFYDASRLRTGEWQVFDLSYRKGLFFASAYLYFDLRYLDESEEQLKARAESRNLTFAHDHALEPYHYLPQPLNSFRKKTWATLYDEAKYIGPLLAAEHRSAVAYNPTAPSYLALDVFYNLLPWYKVYVAPAAPVKSNKKDSGDAPQRDVFFFYGPDPEEPDALQDLYWPMTSKASGEYPFQVADDLPLLFPAVDSNVLYAQLKPIKNASFDATLDMLHALWLVCQTARMDALATYGPLAILSFVTSKWLTLVRADDEVKSKGVAVSGSDLPAVRQLFAPGYQGRIDGLPPAPSIPADYVLKEDLYANVHAKRFFGRTPFPAYEAIGKLASKRLGAFYTPEHRTLGSDAPAWIAAVAKQTWDVKK